jgi:flagellar biosynthesis chaperone FliJ
MEKVTKEQVLETVSKYKEKSNKELEIALEFINTEFEKTKENLIKLTDHLDKLEITYNTILKEYKNRNAR